MTITVEDGSNVANANSYVSVADAREYAAARGATLSDDDSVVEQQLITAMDFIEAHRANFQGTKTSPTQTLQWPREDVFLDFVILPTNFIPKELIGAQCSLVIAISNGVNIAPVEQGPYITSEAVGTIKTTYSEKIVSNNIPFIPTVYNLLTPLFNSASKIALNTIRV